MNWQNPNTTFLLKQTSYIGTRAQPNSPEANVTKQESDSMDHWTDE